MAATGQQSISCNGRRRSSEALVLGHRTPGDVALTRGATITTNQIRHNPVSTKPGHTPRPRCNSSAPLAGYAGAFVTLAVARTAVVIAIGAPAPQPSLSES